MVVGTAVRVVGRARPEKRLAAVVETRLRLAALVAALALAVVVELPDTVLVVELPEAVLVELPEAVLALEGTELAVDREAAAVPSFANWRLAALPAAVDRSELEKLLSATDATTFVGMRDRSILLCMTDLGLRASDVAAITTDGFDPTTGILRIEHPKERRMAELPMSKRLARALGQYLRRGRPRCSAHASWSSPIAHRWADRFLGVVVRCAGRAGLGESIRGEWRQLLLPVVGKSNCR